MKKTVISIQNLTKIYKLYDRPIDRLKESLGFSKSKKHREHYALNNISFDINKGETVGIIGTNGSGKSTCLKIITGVLNPTEGNITVEGRISALLELGAGFNGEYTGLENVYLNGTMLGFSKDEIDKKLQDILDFADIGDFIHQPVKTYSSGMFVRLAFAVAINIDPEILIVDEALSVGDVFFQSKCYHKFEEFKKRGKTILFVSHDLGSIAKYCDRVILLNKGDLLADGSPKEVIDLYKQILVDRSGNFDVAARFEEKEEHKAPVDLNPDELWKNSLPLNPETLSYGEKQAEIVDFAIIDEHGAISNAIRKDTPFKIRMKVHFNEDVDEPVLAFTIKDLQGTEITGTNTMFEKIQFGLVKKGEDRVVEFSQQMTLQGKEYLISLGCVGFVDNDFSVYHRLYDVCNLTVISDKNTVGFYDMNSSVEIL